MWYSRCLDLIISFEALELLPGCWTMILGDTQLTGTDGAHSLVSFDIPSLQEDSSFFVCVFVKTQSTFSLYNGRWPRLLLIQNTYNQWIRTSLCECVCIKELLHAFALSWKLKLFEKFCPTKPGCRLLLSGKEWRVVCRQNHARKSKRAELMVWLCQAERRWVIVHLCQFSAACTCEVYANLCIVNEKEPRHAGFLIITVVSCLY